MEKRVIGVVLTILGIIGLIMSATNFVNHASGGYNARAIAVYGILGFIFFFAGIGLIRSTKDVSGDNEHVN